MATATQIVPLSEYLDTIYHPDRDYIDGELRERNVGKWEHARLQWLIAGLFMNHESEWNVVGSIEQRMQVAKTRIRIADLVVLRPGPQPDILVEPPLLVIEILSPDDTYSELQERCHDYRNMGVETVWIIDPKTRSGRMCSGADWVEAERLEVPGTTIHVSLTTLFSQINLQAGSGTTE
jgi:Uma2 family endonuclease